MGSSLSTNGSDKQWLYSACDCPVCFDSGAVLLLRASSSGRMIFFCPLCGVAWREPPLDRRIDEILSLEDLAPNGVTLPTASEALTTGLDLTTVPLKVWVRFLEDLLDPRSPAE